MAELLGLLSFWLDTGWALVFLILLIVNITLCLLCAGPFSVLFFFFFLFFSFFCLSRAAPVTYGVSQGRGQIGVIDASHSHSHSNAVSEIYTTAHSNAGSLSH